MMHQEMKNVKDSHVQSEKYLLRVLVVWTTISLKRIFCHELVLFISLVRCSQMILLCVGCLEPLAMQTFIVSSITASGVYTLRNPLNRNEMIIPEWLAAPLCIMEEERLSVKKKWSLRSGKRRLKRHFSKRMGQDDPITTLLTPWLCSCSCKVDSCKASSELEAWECNSTEQWSGGNMDDSSLQREGKQQKGLSEEIATADH